MTTKSGLGHDHRLTRQYGIAPVHGRGWSERLTRLVYRLVGRLRYWRSFAMTLRLASPIKWPWCLLHGHTPQTYRLYGLDRNDRRDYLSLLDEQRGSRSINATFSASINNKLLFPRVMEQHGIPCPAIPAHVERGRIVRLDGGPAGGAGSLDAIEMIDELLETYGRLIFKPANSGGGRGIFFLDRADGHGYLVNGRDAPADDVRLLVGTLHQYVIVQVVEQAAYARRIYPGTTNTLRILTLWDQEADEPFVAATAHRFGSSRSGLLDNFHGGLGGYATRVDLETGVMDAAFALDERGRLATHERHRDTDEPIAGVAIPGWRDMVDRLLAGAAACAFADCMGWDLIMTDDGWTCIETNSPPRTIVWQVHTPLLVDPRTRRACERLYGVKPRR